jgi:hypothetical protein
MDPFQGIFGVSSASGLTASASLTSASGLLASGIGLLTPGLFGDASTVVEISGLSQLLSAATSFQDQLLVLQPGSANATGDLISFASEAQYFVDAYNGIQVNIANINAGNTLLGGSVTGASALGLTLDAQAQANYDNGGSALTSLSQIGIELQPATVPGGGGSLSINLDTLVSAFESDPAAAFSLLSQAANAFAGLAGTAAAAAGNQIPTLNALTQASTANQLLSSTGLFPTEASSNAGINSTDLLVLASLAQSGPSGSGSLSLQQVVLALNQFSLVSTLFG